ncbi:MAG: polysaccharide deacetylase family protein [Acidobacteriota bacterium]
MMILSGFILLLSASVSGESLVEKLGYPANSRLLIVNCDDVGMCHAANMAAIEGQEKGMISSGTIMVPCPWFPEIANYAKGNPGLSFGVHLTHTAEWEGYRWGPVAPDNLVPGLLDPEGFLWRNVPGVYEHSSPQEAYIEARAQIEKFRASGLDPTHIDSHMGTLMLHPEYFKMYAKLALEYNLPLRMASQKTLEENGAPDLRVQTAAQGLVFPDYFVYGELGEDYPNNVEDSWIRILSDLKPGVTEIYIHASTPGEELKAATNSWKTRVEEYNTFTRSKRLRQLFDEQNIKLISYKPLKELQQKIHDRSEAGK